MESPLNSSTLQTLTKLSHTFKNCLTIPKHATNTVYVEGLPHDATEREISRIIISIS